MKYLFIFLLLFQNVSFAVVKKGGHFKYNLKKSPATLNPFTSVDLYGALVHRRIFETLLRSDISSNADDELVKYRRKAERAKLRIQLLKTAR